MKYVPNALTIGRIILAPVVLAFLLFADSLGGRLVALALFVIAAISDYLDGKLARKLNVGSRLGQFLDPLADKILVIGTFIGLAILMPRLVPWWAVALIAARDAFVTGLRTWKESRGRSLRTLNVAKAKTTVQLVFLIATLIIWAAAAWDGILADYASLILDSSALWYAMLFVTAFTVWTGLVYLVKGEEG